MDADFEQTARSPDSDWPEFYADQFVERYARSPAQSEDKPALYHSHSCPFCVRVRSAIDRLGLDVELREIFEEPGFREQLVEARGRATVPVMRITSPDGEQRWMSESRDIVRYRETVSER